MATTTDEVTQLYNRMLIPLGIIYSRFMSLGRGPGFGSGAGLAKPLEPLEQRRVFSEIPIKFGSIMGHQFGIFLGDLDSEKLLYGTYNTDRTAVVINVKEVNSTIPDITKSGVALLLAHELGHAFRWYLGHKGGNNGYTSEIWARTLELAYVEALPTGIVESWIGVDCAKTLKFITAHRKTLYKQSDGEKLFYSKLTGDSDWTTAEKKVVGCPKGDPACFRPPHIARLHKLCGEG